MTPRVALVFGGGVKRCYMCGTRGTCPECRERARLAEKLSELEARRTPEVEAAPQVLREASHLPPEARNRVVGYIRVSTASQAEDGYGLDAQEALVRSECERRGWDVEIIADQISGTSSERPGLDRAVGMLRSGECKALVVAKIDRLSRSVPHFAQLLASASREGWELVVLDLGLDTTTPHGRFAATILAAVAQLERDLISQRTKEAMRQGKLQGKPMGRPSASDHAKRVVAQMREEGCGYLKIANELNRLEIPTPQGGKRWYPSSVRSVSIGLDSGL